MFGFGIWDLWVIIVLDDEDWFVDFGGVFEWVDFFEKCSDFWIVFVIIFDLV